MAEFFNGDGCFLLLGKLEANTVGMALGETSCWGAQWVPLMVALK
jgi:hypothetical protein